MTEKQVRRALIMWATLLVLLVVGWKFAFDARLIVRIAGNSLWAVAAIGFGRWFIWIARMESRIVCDVCEGKKHRK